MAAAVAEREEVMEARELSDDDGIGSGKTSQRSAAPEFQLWKPERFDVPDHLAETRVFPRIKQTKFIEAQPDALHFGGFQLNTEYVLKLNLVNISDKVTRVHILPPQTKFFSVHYRKVDRLVPGLAIKCEVRFTGKEYRYYYDAIRIHGPSEENLTVPLHAYPTLGHQIVPENLRFQDVAVGHSQVKQIPLCNVSPVTFEYRVIQLQPNHCFEIWPLDGEIPANGITHIKMRYKPHDFTTQHCAIQIDTSQFNAKPIVCRITGSCSPGQERSDALQSVQEIEASPLASPVTLPEEKSDVERPQASATSATALTFRERRRQLDSRRPNGSEAKQDEASRTSSASSGVASDDVDGLVGANALVVARSREASRLRKAIANGAKFVSVDGLRIPMRLDNPTAVSVVLNQHFQQVKVSELRNVGTDGELDMLSATRQTKATVFDRELQKWNYEERQNQLRWQTRLGFLPMTQKERREVVDFRERAIAHFHLVALREPLEDEELLREVSNQVPGQRTVRMVDDGAAAAVAHFDTFSNSATESSWRAYYHKKFVDAASRVVLTIRLQKRLVRVTELARAIRTGVQSGQSYDKVLKALFSPEELASPVCDKAPLQHAALREPPVAVCSEAEVQLQTVRPPEPAHANTSQSSTPRESRTRSMFDKYEQPLKAVQVPDTFACLVVRRELPVFEFEVPKHASLMQYARVDPHEAESTYIPAHCPRSLRADPQLDVELVKLDTQPAGSAMVPALPLHNTSSLLSTTPSKTYTQAASKTGAHASLSTIRSESTATVAPTRTTVRDARFDSTTAMTISTLPPSQLTGQHSNMDIVIQAPSFLFKPIAYHELHVFNPAPGLQVFAVANSYSEIDIDRSLVPIGCEAILISGSSEGKSSKQRPAYVQRSEVIRGALTWKRFSKWGSASNGDVMASVIGDSEDFFGAATRFTDRFANELLPTSLVPDTLDGLNEDDRRVIQLTSDEHDSQPATLTPEMLAAQFTMIDERPVVTTSSQLRGARAAQTVPASNSTGTMSEKGDDRSLAGFDRFGRKIREFMSLAKQLEKPVSYNVTDVPFF